MNYLIKTIITISILIISVGANSLSLSCQGESKFSSKKSVYVWDEGNYYPDRQTVVLNEGRMTLSNFPNLSFEYTTEPDSYSHSEISVISGDRRMDSYITISRENGEIFATITKYTNSREDSYWFDDDSTDIIAHVVKMQCRKPKVLF